MEAVTQVAVDPLINTRTLAKGSELTVVPNSVQWQNIPAVGQSQTSVNWVIQSPSVNTFINRCIRKHFQLQITLSSTAGVNLTLAAGKYALRSLADLRCIQNEQLLLSGTNITSTQTYLTAPDFLLHCSKAWRDLHPLGYPDQSNQYFDMDASSNNPLSDFTNSQSWDGGIKRGAYRISSISTTGAAPNYTTISFLYDIYSFIYYPGLFGPEFENDVGLVGQTTVSITDTLNLAPQYVWSQEGTNTGGITVSNVAVTLVGTPDLTVRFAQPDLRLMPKLPIAYKCFRFAYYSQVSTAPVVAGASSQITASSIQLDRMPHYIMWWVADNWGNKTIYSTDTFAQITQGTTIQLNNLTMLQTNKTEDFWMMSRDCGLLDTLSQFTGQATCVVPAGSSSASTPLATLSTVGSFCIAEVGRHISTGGIPIGAPGAYGLQLQVNFTNTATAPYATANGPNTTMISPTLNIVAVFDQELNVTAPSEVTFTSPVIPLSALDVAGSGGAVVEVPWSMPIGASPVGGGFLDWLKRSHLISNVAKTAAPLLGMIPGVGLIAGPASGALGALTGHFGLGAGEGEGGASMRKEQLKHLLKRL